MIDDVHGFTRGVVSIGIGFFAGFLVATVGDWLLRTIYNEPDAASHWWDLQLTAVAWLSFPIVTAVSYWLLSKPRRRPR